jgi:hypothetical protein
MPGFDGRGPQGMGPMTGGGRGYCSPSGMRAARQPYRTPSGTPRAFPRYGAHGFRPVAPQITREQELELLKKQAQSLRNELEDLESEIGKISAEKE